MRKHSSNIALVILIIVVGWLVLQNQRNSLRGKEAPDFSLPVLDSEERIGPQDFSGKVLLLDFWATYCGPCAEAMPEMKRLHDRFGAQDFQLLSINIDPATQRDLRVLRRWKRHYELEFPVLLDIGSVSNAYHVGTIPHIVVIDQQGMIRFVHSGGASEDRLRREIEELLGESS